MSNTTLQVFEQEVMPDGHPFRRGASRSHRVSYRYPNGSEIVLGGFDMPTRLLSSEYDGIYVPEAIEITEEDLEIALTRLRGRSMPYRVFLMDTNPGPETHWLWRWHLAQKLRMIFSTHKDNPVLWDERLEVWTAFGEEYLETLGQLQGSRRERMLLGKWGSVEGARFPQFDRSIHVFDKRSVWPYGVPTTFKKIIGVDYGLASPYVALWTAIDYDGNAWTYREDYQKGFTADVQARRIIELSPVGEAYDGIYLDSAMWQHFPGHMGPTQRSAHSLYADEFSEKSLLGRFPSLTPGTKEADKNNGLSVLDALLNNAIDGRPGAWRIDQSCENLIRELESAQFEREASSGLWLERLAKTADDHAIDAAIYSLHTFLNVPVLAKPEFLNHDERAREIAQRRMEASIERLKGNSKRRVKL